jgi:hypothetical protein
MPRSMTEIHEAGQHVSPRPMCQLCYPDRAEQKAAQQTQRERRAAEDAKVKAWIAARDAAKEAR